MFKELILSCFKENLEELFFLFDANHMLILRKRFRRIFRPTICDLIKIEAVRMLVKDVSNKCMLVNTFTVKASLTYRKCVAEIFHQHNLILHQSLWININHKIRFYWDNNSPCSHFTRFMQLRSRFYLCRQTMR